MRGIRLLVSIIFAVGQFHLFLPTAHADTSGGVVISQMYPGASGAATQEFVELYNNAASPVDVTNWCLYYISYSGGTTTKLGCLTPPDSSTKLWLPAGGRAIFVSNEYKQAFSATADVSFAGGMSPTGGHVKLVDSSAAEIDRLGWGTAVNPETTAATAPANTKSLARIATATGLQDTNNNANDFAAVTPVLHASNVYEVVTLIDLCPNIAGAQATVPDGYAYDDSGNCQPDSCLNIDGLQLSVPDGYDSDASGNCTPHDVCNNVDGIQTDIPDYMVRGTGNDCVWDVPPLQLTEIMPNAVGTDTGNEFVEVYNPTDHIIDLGLYSVTTGIAGGKTYSFPVGATIAPGEYRAFYDSAMKFTLVNTTGRVVLNAIDDSKQGDTGEYDSPKEGESWALIDGAWQYTNQPTPGAPNKPSEAPETSDNTDSTDGTGLAPCPAGKYRNPLTNRCRNIVEDATMLADCGPGKYRNPETNRCRKIEVSTLTPCKPGQYRSPETNRCRNATLASATLKPCRAGQERNPDTNRCRNATTSVPAADFAVQPIKDTPMTFAGWWAFAGVGTLAAGYGAWEWRRELLDVWRRLAGKLHR